MRFNILTFLNWSNHLDKTPSFLSLSYNIIKITITSGAGKSYGNMKVHLHIFLISTWRALYTSVKLNDFTVWRHTSRNKLVNCAVLTGNSAGLRTVLSSRLSNREMRSSHGESHSFLSLRADSLVFIRHSHTHKQTHRTDKNWQILWETCALPENIEFSFSCSFLYS